MKINYKSLILLFAALCSPLLASISNAGGSTACNQINLIYEGKEIATLDLEKKVLKPINNNIVLLQVKNGPNSRSCEKNRNLSKNLIEIDLYSEASYNFNKSEKICVDIYDSWTTFYHRFFIDAKKLSCKNIEPVIGGMNNEYYENNL